MADEDLTKTGDQGIAGTTGVKQGSVVGGQGIGGAGQPVTPAKRRRRRRRPRSKRGGLPPKRADALVTAAPVLMEEEVKEALDQPRDSVLEMEKERDEAKTRAEMSPKIEPEVKANKLENKINVEQKKQPKLEQKPKPKLDSNLVKKPDEPPVRPKPSISFSVISEEKKSKDADSMTYEAPIFMPTKAKIPESPKQEAPFSPIAEVQSVQDPWSQSQPQTEAKPDPTPAVKEEDQWAQPQSQDKPIQPPVSNVDPLATPQSQSQPEPWEQKLEPKLTSTSAPAPAPSPAPVAPFDDYKSPFDDDFSSTPQSLDPFAIPVNEASPTYKEPVAQPSPFDEPAPASTSALAHTDQPMPMASPFDTTDSVPASPFDTPSEPNETPMTSEDPFAVPQEEPIEAEVISEVRSADSDLEKELEPKGELLEHENFSQRLEKLLAEANLTPRHLKFCCGGIIFVIVVIILAFVVGPKLLKNGIPFFNNDSGDSTVVEDMTPVENISTWNIEIPPIENMNTVEPQQVITGPVWVNPSVYGGLLLGEPTPLPTGETGVNVGVSLGEELPASEGSQFQVFLSDFEDLYNLYYVDVNALLDGSNDRAKTLDDHILTLKDHYNQGAITYQTLGEIKAQLKVEYDGIEIDKQIYETQFFDEMKVFDGATAEEALAQFVELKQEQVELKAQYFAFGRLEYNYETVLDSLLPLISDFEMNREALIAGVQVVDVLNSDLDLILSESKALE